MNAKEFNLCKKHRSNNLLRNRIVSHVLESYTHAKHCMVSVLDFSEKGYK